jgi:hypothetical protein
MVRPGVEVVTRSAAPTRGAPSDTGTAFFAGITERGPVRALTPADAIHNMSDFIRKYGSRVAGTLLYDSCDAAFQSGVTSIYVGRAVGPAAAVDTKTLNDAGAVASIAVDTIGPWNSPLTVAVVAGTVGGTFQLVLRDSTLVAGQDVVETSRNLLSPADAVDWSTTSAYVRVRALGANNPAVAAAAALNGGTNDAAGVTDVQRIAALTFFPKGLGPGQVAYPGATTSAMHAALANHAQANNRFFLADMQDTSSAATLIAADRADATKLAYAETVGMAFGSWHTIAGVTGGTTRVVPSSAIVAGLMARSDAALGNPNAAAAGGNGASDITLALTQPEWIDTDRQALNDAGINIFRSIYGNFRLYGYRTLANNADPASWAWESAAAARLRMAIQAEFDAYCEGFVFSQLDGRGQTIARFAGGLSSILLRYWTLGALYGATAAEAYSVDAGPTVNTPDTIANNELHALVGLRTSPFAELVHVEVVKVPSNQHL